MPTLSIVATPIGNLEDLSLRAARVLREASMVLCEDTRVTAKLMSHLEAKVPLVSVHEHTSDEQMERMLMRAGGEASIAYVCDAGTPGMNDPGGKLVKQALKLGFKIVPIPGPSALTAAISVCAFPMERFFYAGFLPHKKGRNTLFKDMAEREEAVIFLESTHRIEKALIGLKAVMPPARLMWVGRELTKQYETLYRGTIDDVIQGLKASSWKGEFICVLAPLDYAE